MALSRSLDADELVERPDAGPSWWGSRVMAAATVLVIALALVLGVVVLSVRGEVGKIRKELDAQRLRQYADLKSAAGDVADLDSQVLDGELD